MAARTASSSDSCRLLLVAVTIVSLSLVACSAPSSPDDGAGDLSAVDALAASLAARIVAGDRDTAALAEAFAAAGIAVAPYGAVEPAIVAWFLLDDFSFDVLIEGSRKRLALPFEDLIAALQEAFGEFDDADFAAIIIEGLREAVASDDPSLRFWGRFIVELGRKAHEPFDLLGDVDPSTAKLSLLQMTLIGVRLFAGIYAFLAPDLDADTAGSGARPSGTGCTGDGIQAHVIDVAEATLLQGNSALLSYLVAKRVSGAAAVGRVLASVNVGLAYVKLAWTMVAFEGSLEMPSGPYLVRTKSTTAYGETQEFVYRGMYRLPNASWINCFRLMLANAGIEFSLPDDGPIEGATVNWRPLAGFGMYGTSRLLEWRLGFNPSQVTDADGVSHGFVDGVPQRKRLPSRLREVHKPAMVGVDVSVQPASMFRDLLDAFGGSLATLPAQLLMRTRWAFNSDLPFTVIDWEDACVAPSSTLATRADAACVDEWVGESTVITSGRVAGDDLRIEVTARVVWRPTGGMEYAAHGAVTWIYSATNALCDVTARVDDLPIEDAPGLWVNLTQGTYSGQGFVELGTVAFTETCPDGVKVFELPNQWAEWFNAIPEETPPWIAFDPGGPLEGTLTFTYSDGIHFDSTTVSSWIFTR
jgi:hypothetical protein